jgi:acyl-CoA thioesterase I
MTTCNNARDSRARFARYALAVAICAFSVHVPTSAKPEALQDTSGIEASLSPECRVPVSELLVLGPLPRVSGSVAQRRALTVLAIGPSAVTRMGQRGGRAPFPVRLQQELEGLLPGIEVSVEGGRLGEITARATDTLMNFVGEVAPDLIVWQVGTNDALAHAEITPFGEALDGSLKWLRSHEVDVILVEPPYTSAMANDAHFAELVGVIRDRARENTATLIRRSAAMRYLEERKTEPAQDRFDVQNLGYHCTTEHVGRVVALAARP